MLLLVLKSMDFFVKQHTSLECEQICNVGQEECIEILFSENPNVLNGISRNEEIKFHLSTLVINC